MAKLTPDAKRSGYFSTFHSFLSLPDCIINPKSQSGGDTMPDWIQAAQALNRLIRPLTFPIAVKLVKSAGDFPEKTRRPVKDMGFKTNVCVGMTLSRKYGWTVGMTAEDNACPIVAYTYGWSESEPEIKNALMEFMKAMNYAANDDAARTAMEAIAEGKLRPPPKEFYRLLRPENQRWCCPETAIEFGRWCRMMSWLSPSLLTCSTAYSEVLRLPMSADADIQYR